MRRFSMKIACSAVLLLACANALLAQDTAFVHQGARVRVTLEERKQVVSRSGAVRYALDRLVGNATMLKSDTLVLLPEDADTPLSIPHSKIKEIEVSRGKRSNIGKGAWIGAVGGVVAGAVVGRLSSGCDEEPRLCITVGAAIGAAGGAILGVGVGALIKNEPWDDAQLPKPPPVALNVGRDGSVRLAFSVRL